MPARGITPFADPRVLQALLGGMSGPPVAQGAGALESLISGFMNSGQFGIPGNPLLDYAMANPQIRDLLSRSQEFAPAVAQRGLQQQMQPQRVQVTPQNAAFDRFTNEQLYRASRMPEFAQGAVRETHRRGLTTGDLVKQYGGKR